MMTCEGCGNGRYLDVNPLIFKVGCDRSEGLIDICRERGFDAFIADGLLLPYRSAGFDAVISIAVLHHLSTQEHRIQAVKELVRIARPGAHVLIYVWAVRIPPLPCPADYITPCDDVLLTLVWRFRLQQMEQEERAFGQQDLFVPWHVSNAAADSSESPSLQAASSSDALGAIDHQAVAAGDEAVAMKRFYHVFRVRRPFGILFACEFMNLSLW
jgi:hypothetical protein